MMVLCYTGKVSTAEASEKAVLLANRYAPNLVSNLIDIESLISKALITQTYTIETNHKFFRDLFTGTEKSAVKILSPADAQFSSILSKLKSFQTKTKSYTVRPSKQIEFFVGGLLVTLTAMVILYQSRLSKTVLTSPLVEK